MSDELLDGLLSLADLAGEAPLADPAEEGLEELRELGRELAHGLFQSLRILSIHQAGNAAVDEPLRRLVRTLEELLERTSTVHFIAVEGQVYLNDLRVKFEAAGYDNIAWLLGQLAQRGMGGITFSRPLGLYEWKALALLLVGGRPPAGDDPLAHVRSELAEAGVPGVTFERPYFFRQADLTSRDATRTQQQAAVAYAKGVLAVKDYLRAVEAAEPANPLRLRKIVHDLVDVAEEDPSQFLELHAIRGVEDVYYNHSVNVASLAVALGRVLGLSRVELADLGAAAMFHDLGYAALERQEREEQTRFSALDRRRLHPVAGFRSLLRQGEFGPGLLRRLLVTLEHHMTFTRPGGYPPMGERPLSVFSRIVQVADHYDALVSGSEEVAGVTPAAALERVVAAAGSHFDPLMVKALIQVVGVTPYGSLVRLDDGSTGLVCSGGRDPERVARPMVLLVRDAEGEEVEPTRLDLAEHPGRSIAEILDPRAASITPHALLFRGLETPQPPPPEDDDEFDLEIDAEDSDEEDPFIGFQESGMEETQFVGLEEHWDPRMSEVDEDLLDARLSSAFPGLDDEEILGDDLSAELWGRPWKARGVKDRTPGPRRRDPKVAPVPPPPAADSKTKRARQIAEAFEEGGEAAVMRLLAQDQDQD